MQASSGGLVSAIASIPRENQITWIGAADFKQEHWQQFREQKVQTDYLLEPVFLDKKTESLYYNGFSNMLIWPLFHYFPSYAEYDEDSFVAYRQVNRVFADKIRQVATDEHTIWVHDYHLMLVPGFLKSGSKQFKSSFFLHIPFPAYELVKLIPEDWRKEILSSLICADVVGLQTSEHASHLKRALSYFLGIETINNTTTFSGHTTTIRDFPISIDFKKFNEAFNEPDISRYRQHIRDRNKGMKMIFSLDRLDYSKGVLNRLDAFELMLKDKPELAEKVVFVMNVIPSRENISKYAERKKLIEENVSRINGVYGNIHWQPIIYQYQHLDFCKLLACYTACDVILVTPLRDGMNLVAKEFVASRQDLRGCLILSEFAGAADELTTALMVNPNDIHLMKNVMVQAMNLPEKEQEKRIIHMQEAIRRNDVTNWTDTFLAEVDASVRQEEMARPNFLSFYEKLEVVEAYRKARKRLILLDYDGTLIPFFKKPEEAVPGDVIKELVAGLAASRKNKVMLISGRDAGTLENWFRNSQIDIAAEHGLLYRQAGGEWQSPSTDNLLWKDEIKVLMDKYVKMIPGSFLEEKQFSLAWHYRAIENIDEEATRLSFSKEAMLLNRHDDFDILQGNKVIEVKSVLSNKGKFVSRFLKTNDFDFVLAIGDDVTDEDMFNALQEKHHYTIKVGMGPTSARYNVVGVNNVIALLEDLSSPKTVA